MARPGGPLSTAPKMDNPPKGWICISDWCARAGGVVSPQSISLAVRDGRIPMQYVARGTVRRQAVLLLDWDNTAYDFFAKRQPTMWPPDFELNDAREYKPMRKPGNDAASKINALKRAAAITGEDKTEEIAEVIENSEIGGLTDNLFSGSMMASPVTDLYSAKYRKEQLDIEKRKMELLKIRNDMIEVSEVAREWAGMGVTLRAEFDKSATQLSSTLATVNDPREVKRILTNAFSDLCDLLWKDDDDRTVEGE